MTDNANSDEQRKEIIPLRQAMRKHAMAGAAAGISYGLTGHLTGLFNSLSVDNPSMWTFLALGVVITASISVGDYVKGLLMDGQEIEDSKKMKTKLPIALAGAISLGAAAVLTTMAVNDGKLDYSSHDKTENTAQLVIETAPARAHLSQLKL